MNRTTAPEPSATSPDRRRASRERRNSLRRPFVAAVRQGMGTVPQLSQSADLGLSGMRVRRCGEALHGGPLHLTFALPDGGDEMLQVLAEVVFDRPHDREGRYFSTGLRFSQISPHVADRLRIFLLANPGE